MTSSSGVTGARSVHVQLSQCDARSRNVLICFCYCMKQIDSILPSDCTLITYRGRQNVVRTSVTLLACGSSVLLRSRHVLASSVRYQSTAPRQNGIYLSRISATIYNRG